jgi:hypothetical protein
LTSDLSNKPCAWSFLFNFGTVFILSICYGHDVTEAHIYSKTEGQMYEYLQKQTTMSLGGRLNETQNSCY